MLAIPGFTFFSISLQNSCHAYNKRLAKRSSILIDPSKLCVKIGENTDKWELPTISRKRVYNHHTMKCTNQLTSAFFRRGERKVEAKNFFSTHSESNISLGLLPDLYFSLMHVIPFSRCR